MDDEWVVAKEWTLATTALRRRAQMLESLLPFASKPPADVLRVVAVVQAHARGMFARAALRRKRRIRHAWATWNVRVEHARAAIVLRQHIVREHYAALIQRAFRAYLRRWTRPNVAKLLLRLSALEAHEHGPRKKGWKKRAKIVSVSKSCQTTSYL